MIPEPTTPVLWLLVGALVVSVSILVLVIGLAMAEAREEKKTEQLAQDMRRLVLMGNDVAIELCED